VRNLRHIVFARPDSNDTGESKTKTVGVRATRVFPFAGIIRFRFQGYGGRSRRNLSLPRKTPLQAGVMQPAPAPEVKHFALFALVA